MWIWQYLIILGASAAVFNGASASSDECEGIQYILVRNGGQSCSDDHDQSNPAPREFFGRHGSNDFLIHGDRQRNFGNSPNFGSFHQSSWSNSPSCRQNFGFFSHNGGSHYKQPSGGFQNSGSNFGSNLPNSGSGFQTQGNCYSQGFAVGQDSGLGGSFQGGAGFSSEKFNSANRNAGFKSQSSQFGKQNYGSDFGSTFPNSGSGFQSQGNCYSQGFAVDEDSGLGGSFQGGAGFSSHNFNSANRNAGFKSQSSQFGKQNYGSDFGSTFLNSGSEFQPQGNCYSQGFVVGEDSGLGGSFQGSSGFSSENFNSANQNAGFTSQSSQFGNLNEGSVSRNPGLIPQNVGSSSRIQSTNTVDQKAGSTFRSPGFTAQNFNLANQNGFAVGQGSAMGDSLIQGGGFTSKNSYSAGQNSGFTSQNARFGNQNCGLLVPRNSGTVPQNSGSIFKSSNTAGFINQNSGSSLQNAQSASLYTGSKGFNSVPSSQISSLVNQNSGFTSNSGSNFQNSGKIFQTTSSTNEDTGFTSQNPGLSNQNSGFVDPGTVTQNVVSGFQSSTSPNQIATSSLLNSGLNSQNAGFSQNNVFQSQNAGLALQNTGLTSGTAGSYFTNAGSALRNSGAFRNPGSYYPGSNPNFQDPFQNLCFNSQAPISRGLFRPRFWQRFGNYYNPLRSNYCW